jgi:hypothetical protein
MFVSRLQFILDTLLHTFALIFCLCFILRTSYCALQQKEIKPQFQNYRLFLCNIVYYAGGLTPPLDCYCLTSVVFVCF